MNIANLTASQLRKAADLQERVAKLQSELAAIFGSEAKTASVKPAKKGMSQRWLGTVLLNAESGFRAINGAEHIPAVLKAIEKYQTETIDNKKGNAA